MAMQAEMEPFVMVNNEGINSIDVCDEDLLDQFDDEEADYIYELLCYARFAIVAKLIAPIIILLYVFQSFVYIIPRLHLETSFKVVVCVLIFLTLCSYLKASMSHPGRVPKQWLLWDGQWSKLPPIPIYCRLNEHVKLAQHAALQQCVRCKWCNNHRPFRTGHCSQCDVCIAMMDHHCPFIQNCVGCYNRRFFLQFVLYLFVLLSLYLYYTQTILDELSDAQLLKSVLVVSWFFALAVYGWLIYRLLVPQLIQLWSNQVYIERKFETFKHCDNYFETGSVYKNLEIVLGSSKIRWFLPLEWTKYDLKQRLIDPNYRSFDLLRSNVQLRDAVNRYKLMKSNQNKTKQRY